MSMINCLKPLVTNTWYKQEWSTISHTDLKLLLFVEYSTADPFSQQRWCKNLETCWQLHRKQSFCIVERCSIPIFKWPLCLYFGAFTSTISCSLPHPTQRFHPSNPSNYSTMVLNLSELTYFCYGMYDGFFLLSNLGLAKYKSWRSSAAHMQCTE